MKRGYIYIAGLSLLFIVSIVATLVALQDKQGNVQYAVGSDAVLLEQAVWDAESFVFFVESSLRRVQCESLDEFLQDYSARASFSQTGIFDFDVYGAVMKSAQKSFGPAIVREISLHPFAQPASFDFLVDADKGFISAFSDREFEFPVRRGDGRIGVYRLSPDVTVPLAVEFSDLERSIFVVRGLLEECDARYPSASALQVCVESNVRNEFRVVFPDDLTGIVSAEVGNRCGLDASLSIPLRFSLALPP